MSEDYDKPSIEFKQTANPSDFVGLGIKNTLLGLITITLYRFWGRTEVRQRIWSSSHMNNEPFEYTGTGGELFKGFLIATLIFTLPYLLVIFLTQLLGPIVAAIILFAFMFAVLLLVGAAVWLALRYLSSRTVWRGIRFKLNGDPVKFSLSYFGNTLLHLITLGWWSPKFEAKIAEQLWGNLQFGDLNFNFDSTKIKFGLLYKKYALAWVLIIVGDIILLTMFGSFFVSLGSAPQDPSQIGEVMRQMAMIYLIIFVFLFFVMIAFMPYRAEILKQIAAAVSLEGAQFKLDIDWKSYTMLYITNVLIIVFSLGFLMPVVQVRVAKFLLNNLKAFGPVNLENANQTTSGPDQAEGLSDALDLGII